MIYAIVVKYIDGHTDINYINQKAITATKENACIMGFTYTDSTTGHKHFTFNYVSAIQNKPYPIIPSEIDIEIFNIKAIQIYNTEYLNGNIIVSTLLSTPYSL